MVLMRFRYPSHLTDCYCVSIRMIRRLSAFLVSLSSLHSESEGITVEGVATYTATRVRRNKRRFCFFAYRISKEYAIAAQPTLFPRISTSANS
jgi:hypothetical protein